MLKNLLNKYGSTYASPRSFNNHIGVPLSISNTSFWDNYCVFEVGMNKPNEINKLSKMIKPHIAVITNIAEAHIENFKNIKGIANAKGEIIQNIDPGGTLILNRDDKFFNHLKKLANKKKIKVISFGKSKYSTIRLIKLKKFENFNEVTVNVKNEIVKLKIKDINQHNVLACLAVLKTLNLDVKRFIKIFQYF